MIRVFSHSEPGGHPQNEDSFVIRSHPERPGCYLCAVADGQGGRAGGREAAQIASQTWVDLAAELTPTQLLIPSSWTTILKEADRRVASHLTAGFTTLVGLCLDEERIFGATNGDSAVLHLDRKRRTTILNDGHPKNPPVGSGSASSGTFYASLKQPWKVVAMTDGVWKYVGIQNVARIIAEGARDGEAIIGKLVDSARLPRTGELQDDFTLLLLMGT